MLVMALSLPALGQDRLAPPDRDEGVWPDVVAAAHAPIHYQDTDDEEPFADFLAPFDYDGDFLGADNWDDLDAFQKELVGTAYYSVVETCTHWFVVYAFFHPRDVDHTFSPDEHENDMEGVLAVVEKDGGLGKLRALVTTFHEDFRRYAVDGSGYVAGTQALDGPVVFGPDGATWRPLTQQEAGGHGLVGFPDHCDFTGGSDQDGIVYYPRWTGEVPEHADDRFVPYQLVDVQDGLWPEALLEAEWGYVGTALFSDFTTFRGDGGPGCGSWTGSCPFDTVDPPWGWDDVDDGPHLQPGMLALDPASLVADYFGGLGAFSFDYVGHPYLEGLEFMGWTSAHPPAGWDPDIDLDGLYDRIHATCP